MPQSQLPELPLFVDARRENVRRALMELTADPRVPTATYLAEGSSRIEVQEVTPSPSRTRTRPYRETPEARKRERPPALEHARNAKDLRDYFDAPELLTESEGLTEVSFGEYLVDQGVLDRFQLFRALQMQDRLPGVRLGECAAALGYAPIGAIERLYKRFAELTTVTV
jgi:hypothetical protein